jgi:alkanesulfonate monooxygenase
VIFQAGSSEVGRELAARTAEAVFTPQHSLEGAQAFYRDLKSRMPKYDRSPDQLNITPGLNPIVGRTEQEAEDKHRYLQSLIHPDVGLELLSNALAGFDLRPYDIDGPLPKAVYSVVPKGGTTSFHNVLRWAEKENLSIRQLYERYARGQRTVKGTGAQIADEMEAWFINYGVDGFLIQPSHLPGGLADFIELVIPELQERGLFRTEYEGATLRDHLGLSRPRSRYA